ncbi:MAG: methyltransferase [Prevotella sp.]|nr:methyltransferase [Prevotella sp.]
MSNDYFQFKQFTVHQSRCAMKVGTDGVLLGAWANGGCSILDIGTGTGLIALMMAQRFPSAAVVGIDIDEDACCQAKENVDTSPFYVKIDCLDVRRMTGCFDAIVSNPPYFENSLASPDSQRTLARHTSSLSYRELMESAWRLLDDEGEFSIIIPTDSKSRVEGEAALAGFFKTRECMVKTTPRKTSKRCMLAFRKHPVAVVEQSVGILQESPNMLTDWYRSLTRDFYL